MKSLFPALALLVLTALPAAAARIEGHDLPDSLQRSGSTYALRGCGFRELLFSDIYLLGMYLSEDSDIESIRDRNTGKIFVLKVLYDGDLPDDLPDLWREPLSQQISREMLDILQEQYDRIRPGDSVEFGYQSQVGEEIRINDEVVVREDGRELMPALLDLWLGDDPVSTNLKRLLLRGECR